MAYTRNLFLFFFIIFLIHSSCKKEEQITSPNRTIGLEGSYNGLCTNANNEIIMIGTNNDYDPPSFCNDFIIMKTDQEGNLVWNKKYVINFWVEPHRIVNTAPGEYFVAVDNHIEHPDWGPVVTILVLQLNESGDIIHQNRLESRWGLRFLDMIADQSGGVIVTGQAFGDINHGAVAKINNSGEIEFFHQFPFGTNHVTQYPTGELCYMEYAFLSNDSSGATVHLTSPVGDELFNGTVLHDNDYIFTRFSDEPNHLVMFFSNTTGQFLVKTDFNNQEVWSEQVNFTESERGMILDLLKIGSYYYCLGDHGKDPDGLSIIKYDDSGNRLYQKNLRLDNRNYSHDVHFIELNNGSLVFLHPADNFYSCEGGNCYILHIF